MLTNQVDGAVVHQEVEERREVVDEAVLEEVLRSSSSHTDMLVSSSPAEKRIC